MKILGRDYSEQYDVIIVGSGIGGLFCGNLLAREGVKVLIVEQHWVPGGYCSGFRRKGFMFDSATHFYPMLGNPKTLTGKILQRLEIPTKWHKMDPVDQFHFPDGSTFVVPADFATYSSRLKQQFPLEAENIDAFFADARQAYLYGLLLYFKEVSSDYADRHKYVTLGQKLDEHFKDHRLKACLMADHSHWGSLPEHTSFLFDSMLRLSYFLGNYYPLGSSQQFADDLADKFKELGGDVLLYTNVEKILISKGRVTGVRVKTRSKKSTVELEFKSNIVVSNADVLLTYEQLVGEENCGRDLIEKMKNLRPSYPCYLLHMGLKGMDRKHLEEIEGYYWDTWDPNDLARTFFKIFFTTLFDSSLAPPDHDILIVQRWGTADFEQIPDWRQHKISTEQRILGQLKKVIPDLEEHLILTLSATAYTSYRYTLNSQGAMLGWAMTPDQLGSERPSNETPIENLYLAGHWTRPGGGITPVIISAQKVADLILSKEGFNEVAESATAEMSKAYADSNQRQ